MHLYEVRPRKDHRGVDLISGALPFGGLWYDGPNAASIAVDYAKHRSRAHRAVIRVYDDAGNVIETHEHKGDFKSGKRGRAGKTALRPSHRHRTTGENDANDGHDAKLHPRP
jgi:hypothetical protein